jgi:outer membrane protein W
VLLHLDVAPAVHAWAGVGVGWYWFDTTDDNRDDRYDCYDRRYRCGDPYGYDRPPLDTIEDDFGYHVLVGADVVISGPVSLFVEAKYIFIDTEATVRRVSADGRTFTESHEDVNLDTGFASFGVRIAL